MIKHKMCMSFSPFPTKHAIHHAAELNLKYRTLENYLHYKSNNYYKYIHLKELCPGHALR